MTNKNFADSLDYRALAAAVLLQAAKDVQNGSSGAAAWLLDTGIDWFEFVTGERMDADYWAKWVGDGCPGKHKKKRGRKIDVEECSNTE